MLIPKPRTPNPNSRPRTHACAQDYDVRLELATVRTLTAVFNGGAPGGGAGMGGDGGALNQVRTLTVRTLTAVFNGGEGTSLGG